MNKNKKSIVEISTMNNRGEIIERKQIKIKKNKAIEVLGQSIIIKTIKLSQEGEKK